jgi:hypothetical protein
VTTGLAEFRLGLEPYVQDAYARPFVCTGSPLKCRSFIVGLNAATKLPKPFKYYWSDQEGFDREAFERDYAEGRLAEGRPPKSPTRLRIEAMSRQLGHCLETNIYATPTPSGSDLTAKDRQLPIIEYLFRAIRPRIVFVYSADPIRFFEGATGCHGFTEKVKRAKWQGHEFLVFGRRGPPPFHMLKLQKAGDIGKMLASRFD